MENNNKAQQWSRIEIFIDGKKVAEALAEDAMSVERIGRVNRNLENAIRAVKNTLLDGQNPRGNEAEENLRLIFREFLNNEFRPNSIPKSKIKQLLKETEMAYKIAEKDDCHYRKDLVDWQKTMNIYVGEIKALKRILKY